MLQTLLFFHLLAVVALFTGIGLELAVLCRVVKATTVSEVRAACLNVPLVGPIMGLAVLLLVAMGIAMIYVGGFGWSQGWINVVLAVTLVLGIFGPAVTGRRSDALHALAAKAGDGPVTPEIDAARRDRVLCYAPWMSLFELIAALYIMTVKPQALPAVIIVIVAAAVALIPTWLATRRAALPAPAKA